MLLKKGGTQQLVIAVPYLDTHEGVLFNNPPPQKFKEALSCSSIITRRVLLRIQISILRVLKKF